MVVELAEHAIRTRKRCDSIDKWSPLATTEQGEKYLVGANNLHVAKK